MKFAQLHYPIHTVPDNVPLREIFPDLFKNPEFAKLSSRKECDKIVRYIVYCYDRDSDLIAEHPTNLQERKDAAARLAGLRKSGRGWDTPMKNIFNLQDLEVRDAILCFLRLQNHTLWRELCVTEQELEDYTRIRMTGIDESSGAAIEQAKKKHELKKASEETIRYLESLRKEFYGDNNDLIKNDFHEKITPENAMRVVEEYIKSKADVLPC